VLDTGRPRSGAERGEPGPQLQRHSASSAAACGGVRLSGLRLPGAARVARPALPGWALPAAGGLLVTLIVVMWYSSALWYFDGFRLPLP
jgi:hypothetical protein